ncbi:MAG TPA: bifunctional 4-hydroxy-2-oxoglutarate aldolase/2-dehydro-3-deoxy-phosphogluconate aldolase [Stenotrophomonas sp.]|jgi:2-dehydro-3-deoxyphosphogluconate aldolase/(4S)-4-hydroxy-2-oxoglutarate aldolase
MTIAELQNRAELLLLQAGILPVITVDTLDQARAVTDALLEGGLPAIELTLRTPVAMEAVATLKRERPELVIGAGTVLSESQMRQSIDAGADFLVTPGTPPALADLLADAPIPSVPGAASPTEFLSLMARGFRVCKLFPASAVGGLAMLKGLAGPMADLKLCPTGGITEETASQYLSQPNVLCIGGSWMVPKDWLAKGEWHKVRDSAAAAAQIVRQVRGG